MGALSKRETLLDSFFIFFKFKFLNISGKVVSTCHWGNLLVWEEGHIQLEVTRKDGSTCHDGQINFLVAQEGELITIGKNIYLEIKF